MSYITAVVFLSTIFGAFVGIIGVRVYEQQSKKRTLNESDLKKVFEMVARYQKEFLHMPEIRRKVDCLWGEREESNREK